MTGSIIRYAQVGLGSRAGLYLEAMAGKYRDRAHLVGLCDSNPGRLSSKVEWAKTKGLDVPGYGAEDFERMIAETRPDCIIVTTIDRDHDLYICRAMDLGCDVITEKPMTIDNDRCRQILETQKRTGKSVRVTFNYRYAPPRTQLKSMIDEGVIGDLISVDFHWLLDTHHGADYFRRWHRKKENSGGLMVHKATHHFDLMNWWVSSVPKTVYATGARRYYLPETGDHHGLAARGERCHGCPEAQNCMFFLDMENWGEFKELYLNHEHHDGYFRDRCVFSPDMDIEDSLALAIEYRNGVRLSYSLTAFAAWEGYQITFNGTKGRIEHRAEETVYVSGDGEIPGCLNGEGSWTRVYPMREDAYPVDLWEAEGGHGGGDNLLLADVFAPGSEPDPYGRAADHVAGAWSIQTGIAANRSLAEGRVVEVGVPEI